MNSPTLLQRQIQYNDFVFGKVDWKVQNERMVRN